MKTLFALLFLLPTFALSQTATLTGRVVDTANNEPIEGATVILIGTNRGAITDKDGYYTVINIPTGIYKVHASFVGFQMKDGIQDKAKKRLFEPPNPKFPIIYQWAVLDQEVITINFDMVEYLVDVILGCPPAYPPIISRDPFTSRIISGADIRVQAGTHN